MTVSYDKKFLATACKARNTDTASIFLWETANYTRISTLTCHESTVICLRFSPGGQLLASAGKDRSLCLHERLMGIKQEGYQCAMILKGAHKRIIWDCSWNGDGSVLMTGSRDGYCKVWKVLSPTTHDSFGLVCIFQFSPFGGIAVTSLDIRAVPMENGSWKCCMGSEDGSITVCKASLSEQKLVEIDPNLKVYESSGSTILGAVAPASGLQLFSSEYATVEETYKASPYQAHGSFVQKIRWKQTERTHRGVDEFVSCGDDYSVRIFSVPLI